MINYTNIYFASLILATFLYIIYRLFFDIDPEMDAILYLICLIIAMSIVGVIGFIYYFLLIYII